MSTSIHLARDVMGGTPVAAPSDLQADVADLAWVRAFMAGRCKLDPAAEEMIIYEEDNETVLKRFKCYGATGAPSVEDVYDRVPV